ncbi:MAG TPA: ABC transporter ATP-binding protein [Candidatus Limnocylindrales bacterium]|nr:ABC transporter ATP-binding protein [Candidatus Limnocylindrales bacterium]
MSVAFSGLKALQDVDLTLARGAICGLIGPNGSGKTTLLNVLSGVIKPTEGAVFIGHRDVTGWPAHRIAGAGVARTFQNIRLFGRLTVLENVAVGAALDPARPSGAALKRAAREMLDRTELLEFAERRANTLPYGIRRRVEIARALATKPTFVLLDEPAAGANERESDTLRQLIGSLRQTFEVGILVVEHDLRLIMRLADRIIVLNEGHRIAEGSAEEVSREPLVLEAYLGQRSAGEAQAGHPGRPPTPPARAGDMSFPSAT